MEDFQSKWDNQIETLALKMDNCKMCNTVKEYAKSNLMLNKMKNAIKQKMPGFISFLSKCNDYQTPIINVNGKELMMTYQIRRFIVLSYAVMPLLFKKKGVIRNYLFWSMLLCRENFNIRNYKFNHSPITPIKPKK